MSKHGYPLGMAALIVLAVASLVMASGPGTIGPAMDGRVVEVTEVPCDG